MQDTPVDRPQRVLVSSRAELHTALQVLIGRTRRRLRCLASDLSVLALSDMRTVAALREVLLAHVDNRVQLLVDDMAWLDTQAPRLRNLQRDFPHALHIRCADPQDPVGEDVVAIADDRDALRLQPTVGITGELWCNNVPFVQPLASGFDRRWQRGAHDQPVAPLGL